jgi:membrane-bound lytic murein transglycosylase D
MSDMKPLSIRIRLSAAVASLTVSFSGVALSNSDDAGGVVLRAQFAEQLPWSCLIPVYAPVALPAAQNTASDVWALTVSDIGSAQAERVVHPPYNDSPLEKGLAADLQFGVEAKDDAGGPPYKDLWSRLRAGFAMPRLKSRHVARYETHYLQSPAHLLRVLERSRPYLYFIVGELEKRGMPTEIALLPIIESAYNPHAISPKRAAGIWQFMPATGRKYGLHQDAWYDGRRDVVAASRAALDYLQFLHDMFDDWELALAAYNWGEHAVRRARANNVARSKPTRYSNLKMPNETRNYLPQLQALKNIIASSELLELPALPNEPYFAEAKAPGAIDVIKLARLADLPVEQFRSLNPGYRGPVIIQAAARSILLPFDRKDLFEANLAKNEEPVLTWQAYTPRRSDTLRRIARKFAISVRELREANGLTSAQHIRPRQAILVPIREGTIAQNVGEVYTTSTLLEAMDERGTSDPAISAQKLIGRAGKDHPSRARTAACAKYEISNGRTIECRGDSGS